MEGCESNNCRPNASGLHIYRYRVDRLEDREDIAIFQEWMQLRDAGQVETISLEDLEQELIADDLV